QDNALSAFLKTHGQVYTINGRLFQAIGEVYGLVLMMGIRIYTINHVIQYVLSGFWRTCLVLASTVIFIATTTGASFLGICNDRLSNAFDGRAQYHCCLSFSMLFCPVQEMKIADT
ncbi:hypothetical protein CU097_002869, partial [Rhizopus azygosporus]